MRVHLIGICGNAIQNIARYLADTGHEISGCDLEARPIVGLPMPFAGHDPNHIETADLVVINPAITESSPAWLEVQAARQRQIPVKKAAELVGEITQQRPTITVSGMHGKSTTTGMISQLLLTAQLDPLVFIGAPVPGFGGGNYHFGPGPLVLEADEYDRTFLNYQPDTAVLTNIEPEHLDYYTGGLTEILEVFGQFIDQIKPGGRLIVNWDDPNIQTLLRDVPLKQQVIRFGRSPDVDYQIVDEELGPEKNFFTIRRRTEQLMKIQLNVPGRHNHLNALAALIVGRELDLNNETISQGLADFHGLGRRFEFLVNRPDLALVSDYGHHPTEIAATLAAARAWFGSRRLVLVFQPHQYARTQLLFDDFVTALGAADQVRITDIYGVAGREEADLVSADRLAQAVQKRHQIDAAYLPLTNLVSTIHKNYQPGDALLMMGAGTDIVKAATLLARDFEAAHAIK